MSAPPKSSTPPTASKPSPRRRSALRYVLRDGVPASMRVP
ncbi:Uncharacterised protein [Bordetella pertussis]|nr:Uncharacterised protein [Bordetella pertussis]